MSRSLRPLRSDTITEFLDQPAVLLDFWAEWCGPCQALGRVLESLAAELGAKVAIGTVNVDEEAELAASFAVRSLPTLVLVVGGREVHRIVGAVGAAPLRQALQEHGLWG